MAHISNLTTTDFREVVDGFRNTRNWGSPGIFAGIVLWLTQRDRRFLPVKAIAYNWALSEPAFKKELKTYEILTTTHDRIGTPHTLNATSLDPKSIEWLLECYENEAEDKRGIRARANKAAPTLLKEIENMRKAKTNQLEMALSSIEGTALGACAEELTAAGIGFKVVLSGTSNEKLLTVQMGKLTEAEKLAAVKEDGLRIRYIRDPSKAVQLAAVKEDGYSIQYIHSPSEKVQLEAVKQNGYSIQFIPNPSEKAQFEAVTRYGYSIQYIHAPSKKVQLAAVTQNGYSIQFIPNPSEKVQLAALKQNGDSIRFIPNPSEKVQLAAVIGDGWNIQYIHSPSEKVQLAVVTNDSNSIRFIHDPSEKVQLAAVTRNGDSIRWIKKPSAAVKLYVKNLKNKPGRAKATAAEKWMQKVSKSIEQHGTKNSLHHYFKIPEGETIPLTLLKRTLKKPGISSKTKHRILFALNARKARHGKKSAATAK